MQTRKFGNTKRQTTPIRFESWYTGGSCRDAGWRPQDDEESAAAVGEIRAGTA